MFGRKATGAAIAASIILVMATSGDPALACHGNTVLLKDDFSSVNAAWTPPAGWDVQFSIGSGKLLAKAPAQKWGMITFGTSFFPEADACVDVVLPIIGDTSNKWAGLLFEGADGHYVAAINFDRTVVVHKVNSDGWLDTYPTTEVDSVKRGANAVNRMRLVWNAEPTVVFYINDKLFDTFDARANRNRRIGFAFQTGGATVEYRNLVVTK
jgi:hypothetical protein